MKRTNIYTSLSLLIMISLLMTTLPGCGNGADSTFSDIFGTAPESEYDFLSDQVDESRYVNPDVLLVGPPVSFTSGLDEKQINSIIMLNYLTVLTREINVSKGNRIFLEEAYSSILNNINPGVDSRTQFKLETLLDNLEEFRMGTIQRDRLQLIYDHNRAMRMRAAVPNPLGLLSAVASFDLRRVAASVAYMAFDSYTSYKTATMQADFQFMQDGWKLDDEMADVLHNSRKDAFSYMNEIVLKYDIPGNLALTENAVDAFVEWKSEDNVDRRIQFLEDNREMYQAFGSYWLALANSYFERGDYVRCVQSIEYYIALDTQILRNDYELSNTLPNAIISASMILSDSDYVDFAERYAELIYANTDNDCWALRYFAAQTFVDLYGKTNNRTYLERAFSISKNNVNNLTRYQLALNTEYLSAIIEEQPREDHEPTKAEKKAIKEFNKLIKEERKTALAPLYEPLLLNLDLLFALSKELNLPEDEKQRIENMLQANGKSIFLIPSISAVYSFNQTNQSIDLNSIEVTFNGKEITLPAKYVSNDLVLTVTVTELNTDASIVINDWNITEVKRGDDANIDSFEVTFNSLTAKKHGYNVGDTIKIEITPKLDSDAETLSFTFSAIDVKENWYNNLQIWERKIGFQRVF